MLEMFERLLAALIILSLLVLVMFIALPGTPSPVPPEAKPLNEVLAQPPLTGQNPGIPGETEVAPERKKTAKPLLNSGPTARDGSAEFRSNDAKVDCGGRRVYTKDEAISKYKRAIVRLSVTGRSAADLAKMPVVGSGFIISSGENSGSFIATAAHIIGSSKYVDNPDWKTGPGPNSINRVIKVEILDDKGNLQEIASNAQVEQQNELSDFAILVVNRGPLETIPIVCQKSEIDRSSIDALVIGFQAESGELWHARDEGSIDRIWYRFPRRIPPGLSGAPFIDLKTGNAFALGSQNEAYDHRAQLIPLSIMNAFR